VIVARAPGKLVALGEYAVLDGGPAVVLAVDRFVEVAVAPSTDGACRLITQAAETAERVFTPGQPSGVPLVDLVGRSDWPPLAWHATIDSRAFFAGSEKLGLGSSAAVLCAWAGAVAGFARSQGRDAPGPGVLGLIEVHRAFQGGKGSGLPRDAVRAVAMFQRACEGGDALGCSSLGYMYQVGEGVTLDEARAQQYFRQACDRGDDIGCFEAHR
jgi:TPR repeat protein